MLNKIMKFSDPKNLLRKGNSIKLPNQYILLCLLGRRDAFLYAHDNSLQMFSLPETK